MEGRVCVNKISHYIGGCNYLTHLPRTKSPPFRRWYFQWLFANEIFCILQFRWSLFLLVQLTITRLDNYLAPIRRQVIIWTNADPFHWRIYAALGVDELTMPVSRVKLILVRRSNLDNISWKYYRNSIVIHNKPLYYTYILYIYIYKDRQMCQQRCPPPPLSLSFSLSLSIYICMSVCVYVEINGAGYVFCLSLRWCPLNPSS